MRALEIHTCPILEDGDGWRRPSMDFEDDFEPTREVHEGPLRRHGRTRAHVVGWCNVAVVEIDGERRKVLLARQVPA